MCRYPQTYLLFLLTLFVASGATLKADTTDDSIEVASGATVDTVATIDTSSVPVAFANEDSQYQLRRSGPYRGGRPQMRYRYDYRRRVTPPLAYYRYTYPAYRYPAYRYPAYVYPRIPSMMYYGPSMRVYYGRGGYCY